MCDIFSADGVFPVAIRSMGWTRYEDSFLIAGGRGRHGKFKSVYRLETFSAWEYPTFKFAIVLHRFVSGNGTWEQMDVRLVQEADFLSIMIVGNLCNTPDASNLTGSG